MKIYPIKLWSPKQRIYSDVRCKIQTLQSLILLTNPNEAYLNLAARTAGKNRLLFLQIFQLDPNQIVYAKLTTIYFWEYGS